MRTSATMIKISQALLLAQKKIEGVSKEGDNPFYKSKYATLPDAIEACKKHLNDSGVLVLQPTSEKYVSTVLVHAESGEWVASRTAILCKSPNDPQAQGSAITYARRYGLMSLLFMSAEDDDGNSASIAKETTPSNGLVVSCGVCNSPMVNKTGVKPDGKSWSGWFCPKDKAHPPRWI